MLCMPVCQVCGMPYHASEILHRTMWCWSRLSIVVRVDKTTSIYVLLYTVQVQFTPQYWWYCYGIFLKICESISLRPEDNNSCMLFQYYLFLLKVYKLIVPCIGSGTSTQFNVELSYCYTFYLFDNICSM